MAPRPARPSPTATWPDVGVRYQIHGTVLEYEEAVPELAGAEVGAEPDLVVSWAEPRDRSAPTRGWTVLTRDNDGRPIARTCATDEGSWLRYPGIADACFGDRTVRVRARAGRAYVRRLVHELLVPMWAVDQGRLAVHACAFGDDDGVTLAVGPSGAGKSTLAAAAAKAGRAVLSDDCVIVDLDGERPVALAGLPYVRIEPEVAADLGAPGRWRSRDDKVLLPIRDLGGRQPRRAPVARLAILRSDDRVDSVLAEPLSPVDALATIGAQTFDGIEPASATRQFDAWTTLLARTDVVLLTAPHGTSGLMAALERGQL